MASFAGKDHPCHCRSPERPTQSVVPGVERPGGKLEARVQAVEDEDVGEVESVDWPESGGKRHEPANHDNNLKAE